MAKTLYLIDGHSQIYRAYYAPFGNLTSPAGEPTRATHVFSQMLLNLLRDRHPDYLAMVLDVDDGSVFRREIYPEYKAHRQPAPEDLPVQMDRIVSIVQAVGIPILRMSGFEADDVIATLAARLAGPDLTLYAVSRDKDLDQILSPHVALYDPLKNEVITAERLPELKGWTPQQAIDAQVLIGDDVDNVPGVAGIGPKTAARLLQKYGSAADVIAHANELSPKQRENVVAFAPRLEQSRQLMALRRDVPIELDLEQARCERINWAAAEPIFRELGFRRLLDQLPAGASVQPGGYGAPVQAAPQPSAPAKPEQRRTAPPASLFGDMPAPEKRKISSGPALSPQAAKLAEPDGGDYRQIDSPEALDEFARELARQPEFALDTETTALNPIDADLVGMSFAWQPGRAYYVPVRAAFDGALPLELVRQRLGPILADPKTRKVGHNLKYDLLVLRQAGLPVAGPLFDTMVAAFVIDPSRTSFGLNSLAHGLLGHEMIPITDLIGKGRDQLCMDQVPLARITEYAAEDADYTWRLRLLLEPRFQPAGVAELFYETEMPLVSVLTEMELQGISIDVDFLQAMSRRMAERAEFLCDEVCRHAGRRFNLDSPKQLAEVLFDELGLRVVRITKTSRSTDANTLEVLARETGHAMFNPLQEYRELQKLRGTYVDALPLARSRRTGRVHTSFSQTAAITGRLSSSDPNLQNIPIRTELGREIRRAFIPRSPNERLIVADYSQVELRVLAHFCQDEALIRAFAEDRDIHAFVAAQVNGVPLAEVTKDMRARAKAVNFGIIYGQGPFGLSQTTGMSRTEAREFIDAYFRRYPRIQAFIRKCIAEARRNQYVRTIQGRRRPVPNINSRNNSVRAQAERLAVNTIIQGSAADLIKAAMIQLHHRIQTEHLPMRMLLQVHDELVFEAPADQVERMSEIIRDVMTHALPLTVPLKVDIASGANWLEAK
jgi:DNA polymerase-1